MARISNILIKESLEELQKLYKRENNHRIRTRIKCILLTKEKKFKSQLELSYYLSIDHATLKRWLKQYREEGVDSLIAFKSGGKRRTLVSSDIHDGLCNKMQDYENPLLGYWDAVIWVKDEYGVDLNYHSLRSYLIRNFNTKLKEPRKSHYKKDEQAIEAFKKNTLMI